MYVLLECFVHHKCIIIIPEKPCVCLHFECITCWYLQWTCSTVYPLRLFLQVDTSDSSLTQAHKAHD